MLNRRGFLKMGAGGAAFLTLRRRAYAFNQSPIITKFTVPLPGLGPSGIPVATPVSGLSSPVDIYHLEIQQFQQQILPHPFKQTTLWGYLDANPRVVRNPRYLGPVVLARKNQPVQFIVTNNLPKTHILPVDNTIMGAEADQFQNRTTLHLHGGLTPWTSDGGPFSWYTSAPWNSAKCTGQSFLNGTGVDGQASYYYPNQQSARLLWYHDHAIGITRLNAYAGIASAYLLGDDFEDFLVAQGFIPATQIPLIIQDKSFNSDGSLWYPTAYECPPAQTDPAFPNPWAPLTQSMVDGWGGANRKVGQKPDGAGAAGPFLRARVLPRHDSG